MKRKMNDLTKIIGFIVAATSLVFVIQIHGISAKPDHESQQLAQEAKILTKSFRNDDTKIGKCRALSESPNSDNVTSCIIKTIESNDKDMALLNRIN
ncbi:MAG TPA: hypothetical protein VH796_15420 [Nitrososphaeraceae archaeon]|jgi:hypothetical protein